MVEHASVTRKFAANACVHREVARSPPFLRRNLRHILDSHEKAAQRKTQDAAPHDMVANEKFAAGWDFPTKEMLDDLIRKGKNPVLRLDGLQIHHPKSNSRKRKRNSRDDHDEYVDWLPDPEVQAQWPCQVTITLAGDTHNSKQAIHVESRPATISQYQQANEPYSYFDITLAQPFLVEVSKLFVAVETGTNGFRHWRRTVTAQYRIQVSIQCQDSENTAEFLKILEDRPRANYEHIVPGEAAIRAEWKGLPKCPSASQLLPLKRTRAHSFVVPEYQIALSMGWTRRRGSPLERYNKVFHEKNGQSSGLLRPRSEDTQQPRYSIAYQFSEGLTTRVKTVDGLHCPLCREQPKSLSRLLLHCSTFHDHFKFDLQDGDQTPASGASIVKKTISMTIAPQSYDRSTVKGPEEERCNWIAPERPFDVEAHVAGDDSWTGYARTKASRKRGRQNGAGLKDTQPLSAPRQVAKRPAPEEVPDLPQSKHKKHRVPEVPGVRFYHSLSKKAIEPGEDVSDSDASVDETWTIDIQRQALRELSINGEAQDFTIAFNCHLAREQSSSSILMKEAVVRFTRLHRRELQGVGWQRSFRKKLEQLLGAGVVNRATVTHCIQLIQAAKGDGGVEMVNGLSETNTPEPKGKGKEKANGALPNGMPNMNGVNGDVRRVPSTEPNGRVTPVTNGERKTKGRARWNTGGSSTIDRDVIQPSPLSANATPNGDETRDDDPNPLRFKASENPNIVNGSAQYPQANGLPTPATAEKKQVNGIGTTPSAPGAGGGQIGLCVCGTSAKDARKAVTCANMKCARRDFDLQCVQLGKRVVGWKCRDCTGG